MPRPARYTADALLDAAAVLLADDGPAAVTMSAVARATGAPSGSVYHRFPTRGALCGELWIRTEERFLESFLHALTGAEDPRKACVVAALSVVHWCRERPVEAQVLIAGAEALEMTGWPDAVRTRRGELQRDLHRALAAIPADPERVHAALIDVPYAIVRRHLLVRQAIAAGADAIVADCARALIP